MIRGQTTELIPELCPVSQIMERQLRMITEEDSTDPLDILSVEENDRRTKIIEAH